jgi:hypothetical protein
MYIIYVLRCPISNEVRYVGQTRARIEKRLSNHIWESKKIKKKYSHKDNWILKLSKLELKPIIEKIEEISLDYSLSYVLEKETYWILKYRNNSNLVNATDGGEYSINNRQGIHKPMHGENNPMWNKKHSDSAKKIMSEKKFGLYDGINNPRSKSIYQYDKNLKLLKKWSYAKECADFYKISRGNISTASKFNSTKIKDNKYITCSGFIFSFVPI